MVVMVSLNDFLLLDFLQTHNKQWQPIFLHFNYHNISVIIEYFMQVSSE